MVLINGNRRYKASTNYVDGKVLLTDLDTKQQFYLPVAIAYSYKALRHKGRATWSWLDWNVR